ncbi:MAG: biopolymer transporter ExbD [Planctomycetota bacterium]|nr:biopolymer transporter ExbD [Planctomycetota bacterium]
MRLSSRKRTEEKMELSTTGMIDIVFLLLVFFLVTSSFIPPEKELRPAIKTESKSKSASSSDLEKAMIEIVPEGGVHLYKLGSTRTNSVEKLMESLKSFPNKLDGAFVRADDEAPFDMTAKAISAAKKSGFVVVTFIAEAE